MKKKIALLFCVSAALLLTACGQQSHSTAVTRQHTLHTRQSMQLKKAAKLKHLKQLAHEHQLAAQKRAKAKKLARQQLQARQVKQAAAAQASAASQQSNQQTNNAAQQNTQQTNNTAQQNSQSTNNTNNTGQISQQQQGAINRARGYDPNGAPLLPGQDHAAGDKPDGTPDDWVQGQDDWCKQHGIKP